MSQTRRSAEGAPLSQERFMSSEEYAALRSINGLATTAKAMLIRSEELRRLLFWIQGRSVRPSGLGEIASALLRRFPERITDVARPFESHDTTFYREDGGGEVVGTEESARRLLDDLPDLLTRICVDPTIRVEAGSPASKIRQRSDVFGDRTGPSTFPGVVGHPGFRDILGGLIELMRIEAEQARENHALTSVGRTIWEQLDFCRASRKMVVICGREGIGKTEAVNAWCASNEGLVRAISITSTNSQTEFFRTLAAAVGVGCSPSRMANEMRARSTDVLRRSRLMLVVDEGHYLLPQTQRVVTRPVLLDWLYSGLNNFGVPVAIIATPQFPSLAANVERRTGWNADQFLRRTKRFTQLPRRLEKADLVIVARKVLPQLSEAKAELLAEYANSKEHQLDALTDLATEALDLARRSGRDQVKADDIARAMAEVVDPTLLAKLQAMGRPKQGRHVGASAVGLKRDRRERANPLQEDFTPRGEGRREIVPTAENDAEERVIMAPG